MAAGLRPFSRDGTGGKGRPFVPKAACTRARVCCPVIHPLQSRATSRTSVEHPLSIYVYAIYDYAIYAIAEGALRNSGSAVPIFWIITLPEVMRNMSRPSKRGYGATAYRTNCGWVHSPTREGHALRPRHLHCIKRPLGERKMRTVVSRRHWASS